MNQEKVHFIVELSLHVIEDYVGGSWLGFFWGDSSVSFSASTHHFACIWFNHIN